MLEINSLKVSLNSLSLQRSEMFIATGAQPKDLAPLGAKPAAECLSRQAQTVALLQSFEPKKGAQSYKHLAPLGRSNKIYTGVQLDFVRVN
jgi:hypothetical protein